MVLRFHFRKVTSLIRQYSEPNKLEWIKLAGRIKKIRKSYHDAENYIAKHGSTDTEAERISNVISKAQTMKFDEQTNGKICTSHVCLFGMGGASWF